MSDVAIRVENLGKQYRIGARHNRHDTLRDVIAARFSRSNVQTLQRSNENMIWALRDVSFEVKRGEVVGVIGRNGAGKSTLLKILARITEPSEGGADLYGRVGSLLEVGTGFHGELSGRENIYLSGAIMGMRKREIDRKFDEIVAFAEVDKFIDTPVKHYSSGMYMRLAFAVAAHLEPEILLVDEVLAVGDVEFQKKCLGKMGDVAKEGRTVLFVSHNMAAIRSLCQQGILLSHGCTEASGPIEQVTDEYSALGLARELEHTRAFARPSHFYAWIKSVSVRCNGKFSSVFGMGDALIIEIHFRSDVPVRKPSVGFVISSVAGDKIVNANNNYQTSPEFSKPVEEGLISCNLGVVPWMAGRYVISLWFGLQNPGEHQFIEDAISFEVLERDAWGTGKLPSHNISQLWWPTVFEFCSDNVQ